MIKWVSDHKSEPVWLGLHWYKISKILIEFFASYKSPKTRICRPVSTIEMSNYSPFHKTPPRIFWPLKIPKLVNNQLHHQVWLHLPIIRQQLQLKSKMKLQQRTAKTMVYLPKLQFRIWVHHRLDHQLDHPWQFNLASMKSILGIHRLILKNMPGCQSFTFVNSVSNTWNQDPFSKGKNSRQNETNFHDFFKQFSILSQFSI